MNNITKNQIKTKIEGESADLLRKTFIKSILQVFNGRPYLRRLSKIFKNNHIT